MAGLAAASAVRVGRISNSVERGELTLGSVRIVQDGLVEEQDALSSPGIRVRWMLVIKPFSTDDGGQRHNELEEGENRVENSLLHSSDPEPGLQREEIPGSCLAERRIDGRLPEHGVQLDICGQVGPNLIAEVGKNPSVGFSWRNSWIISSEWISHVDI